MKNRRQPDFDFFNNIGPKPTSIHVCFGVGFRGNSGPSFLVRGLSPFDSKADIRNAYSIASSAMICSVSGTLRPRALAVLRLIAAAFAFLLRDRRVQETNVGTVIGAEIREVPKNRIRR
ncbi:MAG TPA: hypothetical protein VFU70_01680, partial [Pseudolabrys sp.]|nr:hypothetical protein [Pseudolabrys sp.]